MNGIIAVRQDTTPDRLIDNEKLDVDGNEVYRQRVQTPETDALLQLIITALAGPVSVNGTVALDAPTLAALETITAIISGTVALDAPTLAALENIIVTGSVSVSNFPALQSVTGPLTDAELRATPVPVTFTADESGLTDAELRAAPVDVDDGHPDPQTDALTNAQLRATPVPVDIGAATVPISGTVTANLGTIDGASTETTLATAKATLASKLDPITALTVVKSASGDNLLITPAAGKRLQLRWLWGQAKATNDATVIATFKSSVLGNLYSASLEASQPFAHSAVIDLAVNETLSINLDVAQPVIVNADFREV